MLLRNTIVRQWLCSLDEAKGLKVGTAYQNDKKRSRRTDDIVSDLMTIKLDSPDVKDFDAQPAIDVWLQKKKMPYFSGNRSRLRREDDDGPAEIPGDRDVHVCVKAQQQEQAAVPGPSDDAKDNDDGDLWTYYSDDELVTDKKLIDQEKEAYKMLTSMFSVIICVDLAVATNCKRGLKLY